MQQNENDFDALKKLTFKCVKCSNYPFFKIYQYNNEYSNNPYDFNNRVLIYVSCHGESSLIPINLFIKYFNNEFKEICYNCLKEYKDENINYCKDCKRFFCQNCNDYHLEHESITNNIYQHRCKYHLNNDKNLYCFICHNSICSNCKNINNYLHYTIPFNDNYTNQFFNDLKLNLNQIELKIDNTDYQPKNELIKRFSFFNKDDNKKIKLENNLNDAYESYKYRNKIILILLKRLISIVENIEFRPYELIQDLKYNFEKFEFETYKLSEDITKYNEDIKNLYNFYHKSIFISSYYFKNNKNKNTKNIDTYNFLGFQKINYKKTNDQIKEVNYESTFPLINLICFINNEYYIKFDYQTLYYYKIPNHNISSIYLNININKGIIIGRKNKRNIITGEYLNFQFIYIINIKKIEQPFIEFIFINPHNRQIEDIKPLKYNKQYKNYDFMTCALDEENIKIFRGKFPFCCLNIIKTNKRIYELLEIGTKDDIKNYINEGFIIGFEKDVNSNFLNLYFFNTSIIDINLNRRQLTINDIFNKTINSKIFEKNKQFKLIFNSNCNIRIIDLKNIQVESIIKLNDFDYLDYFEDNEIFVCFQNFEFIQYDLNTLEAMTKFGKQSSVIYPKYIIKNKQKLIIIFNDNCAKVYKISYSKKLEKEKNCSIF